LNGQEVGAVLPLIRHTKLFLAFSRGLQAFISIAQPALGAVIALGRIPDWEIVAIGFIAAWAGNNAAFAINDLLDVELDRKRFNHLREFKGFDIDTALVRHPLAQGFLTYKSGVLWIGASSLIAIIGAYVLNPWCILLFVIALSLEISYCKLSQISALKFLITGVMVAVGAMAGWVAVVEKVAVLPALAFFVWMAAWEIGGRNIVNDWSDVEEDVHLGIKTIPVIYGHKVAGRLILAFLLITFISSLVIARFVDLNWIYLLGALIEGWYALLSPTIRLLKNPTPAVAITLFNRASLYPLVMLTIVVVSIYLPQILSALS
jgi:4-hydroxybenzoate polyprenyltransferase